jgi:hypothetical protein
MIKNIIAASIAVASVATPSFAQVTSVTQLKDVQPTEWSYQAISNLISRYGCVAGFPDQTFKPGEAATRGQLAALVNSCLDQISQFYTAADAQLAAALRAEFAKEIGATNARVASLELAAAQKAQGVGNYLGAGVLLNKQGIDGNGYSETRTVSGGTIQGRYAVKTFANQNAVAVRPYVNFVGSPSGQIGAGGGGLVTYDFSIAKAESGVSAANVYAGVGYQIPLVNNTAANFQSAVGEKGQVAFVLGAEGRLTKSLVGFADLKFPTTNASNSYGATGGTYSPVFTTGLGFKF